MRRPPAPSAALLQRAMLAADRGPGRTLLRFAYAGAARGYARYVRRGESGAAAYVRGTVSSGETLHGLSDIDVVVVLAPDPTGAGRARARQRCTRAAHLVPAWLNPVDDWPMIYDEPALREVATRSALTYGLPDGGAIYSGAANDIDKIRLLEHPGLYGPARAWRLLGGPDRRPPEAADDPADRRITSWLELQNWWRWAFAACVDPARPYNAYLCVKLIAEAARIWLWLTRGEVADRITALGRGRVELPAEAEAFERAAALYRSLRRMPAAPLSDFLPPFVRLSTQLADELARQVASAGATSVRLALPAQGEFALPDSRPPQAGNGAAGSGSESHPMPLLDWRALAMPANSDESFVLVAGDPGDPVAVAATASDRGPHLTLSADRLMVRPSPMGGRARLRTVQCDVTDPVSFALARGSSVASFPNVPGFSIQDTARRAVAEHSAWLAASEGEPGGTTLGHLVATARVGLLAQSVAEGEPELALTAGATLERLAERAPRTASVAVEAAEAYDDSRRTGTPPPEAVTDALRAEVLALPAYAGGHVPRSPA